MKLILYLRNFFIVILFELLYIFFFLIDGNINVICEGIFYSIGGCCWRSDFC